jgi:hypothetical protein
MSIRRNEVDLDLVALDSEEKMDQVLDFKLLHFLVFFFFFFFFFLISRFLMLSRLLIFSINALLPNAAIPEIANLEVFDEWHINIRNTQLLVASESYV